MDKSQHKQINEWNNLQREKHHQEHQETYDDHFPQNRKVLDDPESAHHPGNDARQLRYRIRYAVRGVQGSNTIQTFHQYDLAIKRMEEIENNSDLILLEYSIFEPWKSIGLG